MSKQRSRRQRKKLHIGEFKELGFLFEANIKPGADENALIEAFLTEAIDAHGLGFGGWATGGAVEKIRARQRDRRSTPDRAELAGRTARDHGAAGHRAH